MKTIHFSMCKNIIREIYISFLAIGYNEKINNLIKEHNPPKIISLGETEHHDKAKFLPIYKALLEYSKKIEMPTSIEYLNDPPAPYESYKKIIRDIKEYAQFRISHFMSIIAITLGLLSLVIAFVSLLHSFKC